MNKQLCIFGEVLFDHFPDGKRVLGGAPFNVAWHLQAFGQSPYFISRIGNDSEGKTIQNAMRDWGLNTDGIQLDTTLPTGRVSIKFVENEPCYDIVQPVAYDAIEASDLKCPDRCQLLYHGSLALRSETSKKAVDNLIAKRPELVFVDVNLRPPWFRHEQVHEMVRNANWIKLNIDELDELYPSSETVAIRVASLLAENRLNGVILTRGSEGATVITSSGEHYEITPQAEIELVDTVGAGDAFASVMILGLANDWPLDVTLQRAQEFASALVGQRGATVNNVGFYQTFIHKWNNTSGK